MEDKTQKRKITGLTQGARKKIREHFGKSLRELKILFNTPDTETAYELGKEQFNAELQAKREEAKRPFYLASLQGTLTENIGGGTVIIEPANVKDINTYNTMIKEQLETIFNTVRESPPPPTAFSFTMNGEVRKITPNSLGGFNFTPFILMTKLEKSVKVKPILLSNPPKIADGVNSEYKLESPNLCVFNEILTLVHSGSKINKRGASTLKELINSTITSNTDTKLYKTDTRGNLQRPIEEVEINEETIYKYGITKEILLNLARHIKLNVNLYETDTNGERFTITKDGYDAENKRIALNAIIQNNHIYLVKSLELIRSYNAIITSKSRKPTLKNPINITKYVCNENKLSNIDFILSLPHIPNKITLTNGILSQIKIENTAYISTTDDRLKTYYGDNYKGQTPQSIAHDYMKDLKPSYMNETIYNALTADNVKHRTHADILEPSFVFNNEITNESVKKYDLNKAYKYAMNNLKCVYGLDITSEIKPVNKLEGEGLYYVIPKKSILLHGKNWYSYSILEYAEQNGDTFKILYKINVNTTYNVFKDIIRKISTDITDNKTIINSISGLCGITKTERVECKITTSENDVFQFLEKATNPYVKNEKGYYFYGHKTITNNRSNRLIQYIQILDEFNILAHKRAIGTGGLLIARNIDAFYVYRPTNTDHLSNEDGDYKIEEFKPIKQHKKDRNVIYTHKIFKTNILQITDSNLLTEDHLSNGLMVLGMGGTGKTTAIKKIVEDAIFLSPTHMASLKIGGQTIHSYFNINIEDGKANIKKTDKKYLVIDECSMITSDMWEHILSFKVINPTVKIILMGDEHQLPSIENIKYDFSTNSNILELVNHNVVRLTKNYRQDKTGAEISNKIINGEEMSYKLTDNINHNALHITFRNNTRRAINDIMNRNIKGEPILLNDDVLPKYIDGKLNPYKKLIPTYGNIAKGVKVICNKTCKELKISNGQRFIIYNVDENICMEDGTEITRAIFSKHFTLNYAITVYKAQGQTFDGEIQIHDMSLMIENYKYIYTAISRATAYKNISFSDAKYNYITYSEDEIAELIKEAKNE